MAETTPRGPAPRNFAEAGYPPETVEKLNGPKVAKIIVAG